MKTIAVLLFCLLAVSGTFGADNCFNDIQLDCSQTSSTMTLARCNALYGGFRHIATEMQAYANLHLQRSYEYLLTSAYFNNYQTNRVGFSKLFKKLSDESWAKTIDLIQHITKRGGVMDFARRSTQSPTDIKNGNYTVELHEVESLGRALDTQKEIADRAFFIHHEATRNNQHSHDPEIAQYLEEEFIEGHANTIRNLAGHANDVKKFISANNGQDLSLALYLFDEYLQKTI